MLLGGTMKQVIIEYTSAVMAVLGATGILVLLGNFFLGRRGVFSTFIAMVLGGW